jgi:uncharacterized delta-60 repeat protein
MKATNTVQLIGNECVHPHAGSTMGLTLRRPLVLGIALFAMSCHLALSADGDLDPGFGNSGIVFTDVTPGEDEAYAVAIQSDGKIVVAGTSFNGGTGFDFAITRHLTDGSLDAGFGVGGKVITDFENRDDIGYAVAIRSDGKIVVAGSAFVSGASRFGLTRYNVDGSLDVTFGNSGRVVGDLGGIFDQALAVVLQGDGRIVAAGSSYDFSTGHDFALARFNPNGSLDPTFGFGGGVVFDFEFGDDAAFAVAVQEDGRIVAGGSALISGGFQDFALMRYNANGSLDGSFGNGGWTTTDFANGFDEAYSIALQSDGSIIAAGTALDSNGGSGFDMALARYNNEGALDASFGLEGKVVTDFSNATDFANAVLAQNDGRIMVAGIALNGGTGWDIALARYQADGSLDSSFGFDGRVATDVGTEFEGANAMAFQSDGRIVVAGTANTFDAGPLFVLARYEAATPHALTFYLHGNDIPGTASGFTMNESPAPVQTLGLNLLNSPNWYSAPLLTGIFLPGATFKVILPRTAALGVGVTFRLAATEPNGADERLLGQTTQTLGLSLGPRTVNIRVSTPVMLNEQRLKLTISSALGLNLNLQTGSGTRLEMTGFAGTP